MFRFSRAFIFATTLAACSGNPAPQTDDFSDLANLDTKSDSFSYRMTIVGSLDYGQSLAVHYNKNPRYRAIEFGGAEGDQVNVTITSNNGIPVAWVLDNGFHVLGSSAEVTGQIPVSANIAVTLPASKSVTHYIVLRDDALLSATFNVKLDGKTADLTVCAVDSDCVAVDQGGCCEHGMKAAVAVGNEAAYAAAHACTQDPRPFCPLYVIDDLRVAECNTTTNRCEMVQPGDIQCGGFTKNSHQCTDAYECDHTNINPDLPGKCLPKPADCQTTGCGTGDYCSFCWGKYACIPNGALC